MTDTGGADPPREFLSRFPEMETAIRDRFNEDGEFRELCGDYAECLAVISHLRCCQGESGERLEQYCELRVSLESELLQRISAPSRPGETRVSAMNSIPAASTRTNPQPTEHP